ncbi:hypothetical protein D9756_003152 [Leucocoprinus leucothites]|uniref:Uncharacterized protein n=1 Tax=Leucocoprinus leucothites TaxID=201217 RepID=A0A8H5G6M3_9AGAR|nr:hypothetical protein D9756_003152 [Leucoagaricus leucothites]
MRCRFSQENPDILCFCSACHLSSELFPRRQDGKIVLPELPGSGGSPSLQANPQPVISQSRSHPPALPPMPFSLPAPLMPDHLPPLPSQATVLSTSGRADRGHRPRARSNARTLAPSSSSARLRSGTGKLSIPSITKLVVLHENPSTSSSSGASFSTSNIRPRSRSQSFLTTTTAVSNPYPIPVDHLYPKPSQDSQPKSSAPESSSASTSAPAPSIPTPTLKFCPPFVASDRIAISPDSEAAKEGVTMIPWSVRRRKQKYRSGFDTGTGQGKGKTMFRYYGPDNDPPSGSPSSDTSKKQ